MDFGDSAAPDPEGRMAAYIISSAENLRKQVMSSGYTNPKIGLIPMIGVNDVTSEIFRISDAKNVKDFFKNTPWMTYIGWWSTNRDKPGPGEGANPFNSGIKQLPYDFAKTFLGEIVKELDPSLRPNPAPISIPGSTIPPITTPGWNFTSTPITVTPDIITPDDVQVDTLNDIPDNTQVDIQVDGKIAALVGDRIKITFNLPNKKKGTKTIKGMGNIGDKVIVFLHPTTFKFQKYV
jgi:hypothetical protein